MSTKLPIEDLVEAIEIAQFEERYPATKSAIDLKIEKGAKLPELKRFLLRAKQATAKHPDPDSFDRYLAGFELYMKYALKRHLTEKRAKV